MILTIFFMYYPLHFFSAKANQD